MSCALRDPKREGKNSVSEDNFLYKGFIHIITQTGIMLAFVFLKIKKAIFHILQY